MFSANKVLGITVSHTLTFHHHVSALVTKCSPSFYALKTIRAHGLNGSALWDITRATLVWSHFSMPALRGGDILKPMKGTGYSYSPLYPRL